MSKTLLSDITKINELIETRGYLLGQMQVLEERPPEFKISCTISYPVTYEGKEGINRASIGVMNVPSADDIAELMYSQMRNHLHRVETELHELGITLDI